MTDEGGALATVPPAAEPMRDGSRDWNLGNNPYGTSPAPISKGGTSRSGRVQVSASWLEQNLKDFLKVTGRVLKHAIYSAGDVAGMELEEVELTVEVNGEGEISLMGSGVKTGGKGAMTLKFKKAPASSPSTSDSSTSDSSTSGNATSSN